MQKKQLQALTLEQKCALLSGAGTFTTRAYQKAGIPAITLSDGPNGVRKQAGAADHLGLNRSYLSSQFKKETGINLNDFINLMKIDEATRLLVTTDRSVADIASLLAFSSQSYFQSVFKKHTGMTPLQYREKDFF